MKLELGILVTTVLGYGRIGHSLSGMITYELLTTKGKSFVKSLLVSDDLGEACNWADQIKSNHDYDWAKPLHYINPLNDEPPKLCVYNPGPTDCPNDVCVVEAIRNYTTRLIKKQNPKESLLFLIHFIGDLHQPLHATGRMRGGTQAQVRFNGRLTNLHAVWDYLMFEKRISQDFKKSSKLYVEQLVKDIGTKWRSEVPEWLSCSEPSFLNSISNQAVIMETSPVQNLVCPDSINKVNCKHVWPGFKRRIELSGNYYTENIKIEEKMLAQAAVRMSSILNMIAETF